MNSGMIIVALIVGGVFSLIIMSLQKRIEPKMYNEEKFTYPPKGMSKIYLKHYKHENLSETVELLDHNYETFYESENAQGIILEPGEHEFNVKSTGGARDGIRVRNFSYGPEKLIVDTKPDSLYMISGHGGNIQCIERYIYEDDFNDMTVIEE